MTKEQDIKFSLQRVTTEQFATMEEDFQEGEEGVGLSSAVKFGLDEENRIIAVFTKFTFDQNKSPFLIIETGCHFLVDEEALKSFTDEKSGQVKVPKGFITHLAVLAVGTARGVLHAKTESTVFNKFVLPAINVNALIKDDVVF